MKQFILCAILSLILIITLASCTNAKETTKHHSSTAVTTLKPAQEYLSMPELSTVTIASSAISDRVAQNVKELCEQAKGQVFEPVTGDDNTVKKGDQVYLSYTYKNASKELSADTVNTLSKENFYLTIGSNDSTFPVDYTNKNNADTSDDRYEDIVFVEGIERQLIGKKSGEKVALTATFSNTYSTEELRNVSVTYEIEIKAIARISIDETLKVKLT